MVPLEGELAKEMDRLDDLFWVSREKLKEITSRFVEELEEGLQKDGANVPMNITWVQALPAGDERGTFLTLDLGGTNLRVCKVTLLPERGKHKVEQGSYRIPHDMKSGTAEELWNYVAESLEEFINQDKLSLIEPEKSDKVPLGFTFSYPATQESIDHGVLQTWTEGFDIDGVEGHDVAVQLREAMERRELSVKLVALANDTTGALIASHYTDPDTIIGAIFGTGCNAAYMENCGSIPKLKSKGQDLAPDTPMAINCEYGAFDNSHRVLPRTQYDKTIDAESPRPGEQTFEEMSAGLYLGEIFRLIFLDVHSRGLVFKNENIAKLKEAYLLDTAFLSHIENDESPKLSSTKSKFQEVVQITPTEQELVFVRRLAEAVAVRGARLTACGPAAICTKKGIKSGHVAADGSVANKHPKFKARWAVALGEILDWPDDGREYPIQMTNAEDGSGVGVAVITALALTSTW
jgi:hexokinase